MLLEDATSKEQVEKALREGDAELAADIEWLLDGARSAWEHKGHDYVEDNAEWIEVPEIVKSDDFVQRVIRDSPGEYDLSEVPLDSVRQEIGYAMDRRKRDPVFTLSDQPGYFGYEVPRELLLRFPEYLFPTNHEFIPKEIAKEFWKDTPGWEGAEWEDDTVIGENRGSMYDRSSPYYISASEEDLSEISRDARASYVNDLIEQDPDKAAALFLSELPYVGLREKAKQWLSQEDILDFAHRALVEDRMDDVAEELNEFLELVKDSDQPRDVIGEFDRDWLKSTGITNGALWEEAPWKLIRLVPADLPLEGARMRHCVGDKGMGYIQALSDGTIEVWSLRSRANKPRFTLEIDPDTEPITVQQLKGKANRTPGHASANDAAIRFPGEVLFWESVLTDFLGVDPKDVDDFDAVRETRLSANPSRSFDRPFVEVA